MYLSLKSSLFSDNEGKRCEPCAVYVHSMCAASQEVPLSAVESFFCFSPGATFFLCSSVSSLSIMSASSQSVSLSVPSSSLVELPFAEKIKFSHACVMLLGEKSQKRGPGLRELAPRGQRLAEHRFVARLRRGSRSRRVWTIAGSFLGACGLQVVLWRARRFESGEKC